MALYSLYCADVPLRNCSLTHLSLNFVHEDQPGYRWCLSMSGWQCDSCWRSAGLVVTIYQLLISGVRQLWQWTDSAQTTSPATLH